MRKLRLIGIILFAAYGGKALYKYVSEEGQIFISRVKLPEAQTISPESKEVPVQIEEKSSMDEYYEAHKNDVTEIVKKSIVEEHSSMDEYFAAHKADVVKENVRKIIKDKVEAKKKKVSIKKPVSHHHTIKKLDDIMVETDKVVKDIFNTISDITSPKKKMDCKTKKVKHKHHEKHTKHKKAIYSMSGDSPHDIIMKTFER